MCCPRKSASATRRQAGFTLIELMIGVVIGLLASLAVTHVLVNSESNKRATTSGSDAQVNGALALHTLQRALQPAGYGFAAIPNVIGCQLDALYNGVAVVGFPTTLAPVFIVDGPAESSDSIRVLASGKSSYSIPLRVVAPGYDKSDALRNQNFSVSTVRGVEGPRVSGGAVVAPGDLMVAAVDSTVPCELFQVTANPGTTPLVARADSPGGWNSVGFPDRPYGDGNYLINMGVPLDATYSIVNNGLAVQTLNIRPADSQPEYVGPTELFSNIVNLQAYYGKDTDANGSIDAWDTVMPANNAEWRQLVAVRVAIVARNSNYEKEEVTPVFPQWDIGTVVDIAGSVACGASKCINLKVDDDANWKHYRYRVFDTVIPLRNLLWNS
jgi:type IV pilus assembly protein PilW